MKEPRSHTNPAVIEISRLGNEYGDKLEPILIEFREKLRGYDLMPSITTERDGKFIIAIVPRYRCI